MIVSMFILIIFVKRSSPIIFLLIRTIASVSLSKFPLISMPFLFIFLPAMTMVCLLWWTCIRTHRVIICSFISRTIVFLFLVLFRIFLSVLELYSLRKIISLIAPMLLDIIDLCVASMMMIWVIIVKPFPVKTSFVLWLFWVSSWLCLFFFVYLWNLVFIFNFI